MQEHHLHFIYQKKDNIILNIEKKLSKIAKVPVENMEPLQLLRYKENQQYKVHYDWFGAENKHNLVDGGQRTITIFLYLSDDFEGGETYFRTLDRKIKVKKGSGLMWNNLKDGNGNNAADHGGLPVIKGVKWGMNCWFRENKHLKV